MLTIAVCEDNPITSEEICQKIKQYSPMEAQIFSFSDDSDILAAIRERQFEPHIVFMDIELQGSSGIQTAKTLLLCCLTARLFISLIMLTMPRRYMNPPTYISF